MRKAPAAFGFRYLIGGVGLALLLVLGVVMRDSNSRAVYESMAELDRTHQVVHALDRVLASAVDAETGVRGYLVTGRENYLEPYADATASLDGELATLDTLFRDDAEGRRAMASLRARLATVGQQLADMVQVYRTQGPTAAANLTDTGRGKAAMDALRAQVDDMEAAIQQEIRTRTTAADRSYIVARAIGLLTGLFGVIATLGFVWVVRRQARLQFLAAGALHAEREQLRVTLTSIGDGVIVTDAAGQVRLMNRVAEALTGWTEPEATGQPLEQVFRVVNEETRAAVGNPVSRALRHGGMVGLANHTVLIARDGTEHPIADSAAPVRQEGGRTEGAVLVFRDVTAERKAELAMSESLLREKSWSERLGAVAAAGLTINAATTQEGIVGVIDAQARRLLGAARCNVVFDTNPFAEEEGVLTVGLTTRSGSPVGYIRCSGKQKGAFDADDRSMLSQLAQMASVALENSRLYNDIRTSDIRKDTFLATLAHELRNPLAPISNSLEALRRTADPAQRAASQAIIERQVAQLVHLVDDLLDVSRINEGKLELRLAKVQVRDVLQAAIETSQPAIDTHRHELLVTRPEEPVWLDADLTRLAQVFANLLNNSAKYSEPGGAIHLTATASADQVEISVRDTGLGIPPEVVPHVFDLFMQAERSLAHSQGGLGIGLTLVRQMVELHHGTVSARSDGPGHGSEFIVRLPRAQAPAPVVDAPAAPASAVAELPPRRVLVVDDNRDAVDSLALLLKLAGQTVASAFDGNEALEQFEAFQPDIVVLDIGLPALNGYEVARRMRAMPHDRPVLLVALTGWGQEDDRRRTVEAGFDHHLVKPVDFEALKALLAGLSYS